MALESATYISDLDPTNPKGADARSTADDHARLIKQVLQTTWPNISSEVSATAGALNFMVGVTSKVQDQIDAELSSRAATSATLNATIDTLSATLNAAKLDISATAAAANRWGDSLKYVQSTTPAVAANGIWFKVL